MTLAYSRDFMNRVHITVGRSSVNHSSRFDRRLSLLLTTELVFLLVLAPRLRQHIALYYNIASGDFPAITACPA